MSELQEWKVEAPWIHINSSLGEGPFFEEATKTIRFVDIPQQKLHTLSLAEGLSSLHTLEFDVPVTVTCDIEGVDPQDKILVGLKYGLATVDRKTGAYEMISEFNAERDPRLRSNDGAADSRGNFWIGTMTDKGFDLQPEGSLYHFPPGGSAGSQIVKDLSIPNSVGWSPDNSIMYFTHSTAQEIWAFDYDANTGKASNKRLFYHHDGSGDPDGFRVDVDGNIWQAVYGDAVVLKISPEGKLIGKINMPTKNITCVQFAGTELIITTARDESGEGISKEYGGAVFKIDVGTTGLELYKYKL